MNSQPHKGDVATAVPAVKRHGTMAVAMAIKPNGSILRSGASVIICHRRSLQPSAADPASDLVR